VADARIHGNAAANGGGIAVEATAAGVPHLILLGNQGPAAIVDNAATDDGGGLYCSAATMYCDRYCLIADNSAGGNGGGIAQQDCGTGLYLPTSSGTTDPDVGLRANTAAGHGGGAWVSGGWLNLMSSEPQRPAPVVGNVAGGSGGGLYFTGLPPDGATNMHRGVQFDDNRAGGDGGAMYADSGFLMLYAPGGAGCAGSTDGCPRFRANHADLVGGAIALSGDATALVSDVMFSGNDASVASVLALGGAPAGVTLTNVHIAGNHGAGELLQSAGGYVDLRYATVADNGGDDAALIRLDAPASLTLRNSILHDDNGGASGVVVDAASGSTISIDCVLVHDDSGLAGEPGVVNLFAADPQWDASAIPAGLYAPGPDSPAVDACDAGPGVIPDLLGESRPRDLPKPDGAGPFDMGAIERRDDRLFMDGFELS
jgi:predicted outer membrane repeat protein